MAEQVKEWENREKVSPTTFKHKTLEERTAEYGGKLGPYEEIPWEESAVREEW